MAPAPDQSPDEIVRLYESGELPAELARDHESEDGGADAFLQRCISLHNSGDIDLVGLSNQEAFANLSTHEFFDVQQIYCEAIPKLHTNAPALMECCKTLIEKAGTDIVANQPNVAFRVWCQHNPSQGVNVILAARKSDTLARQFVTFALQAANDIGGAIDFIKSYTDDRRLSGMAALADMVIADAVSSQSAVATLEPYVADNSDDYVRSNALLAAFGVIKKNKDDGTAQKLIESATRDGVGPQTLHALALIVRIHHSMLDSESLRIALAVLEAVNPEHLGTLREIDMGLRRMLDTKDEPLALDFLTASLRDAKLKIENFKSVVHALRTRNLQRLYELIVRWFLSGSRALYHNVSELVGIESERAFDTTVQPLALTPPQQLFLCRKAIGFLFIKPVICCSIIVSVLRACDQDVIDAVTELLFDPMLLSYGGDAKDYLKRIPVTDAAYSAIQKALAKDAAFYAGLNAAGTIKELHPSEHQRDVTRQRVHDEMRTVHKLAESKSIFMTLAHRSTILYGKRSLTYVNDVDGKQRAVEMELQTFGTSIELPRRDILDPVGLDYMLRVFRMEKLK